MIAILHTVVALLATFLGVAVAARLSRHRGYDWADLFVVFAALTTITALGFPFNGVTPAFSHLLITAILIAFYVVVRKRRDTHGWSRRVATLSLILIAYAHVLALIIQAFRRTALNMLAPTESEPPIVVAHVVAVLIFAVLGFLALRTKPVPISDPATGSR